MRLSGVLMHISSLPSKYGIGSFGEEAYKFVDFLEAAKQSYWQLLPICPTSFGDSPYQSYSTYAGNPYFIDLDLLATEGLLDKVDYEHIQWGEHEDKVDFATIYKLRYPLLRKAVNNFFKEPDEEYSDFCRENAFWLDNYAIFMAIKESQNGKSWWTWEEHYRNRNPDSLIELHQDYIDEVNFWKGLQYLFFKQWNALKTYANEHGISIIGDLPIYVSLDSVDVWADPSQFQLDDNKLPIEIAGCPPDRFSEDGQLWGNPLYDWDYMEKEEYRYWVDKIAYLSKIYDVLRIDHFRGFDSYYAVPYGASDAKVGVWKEGPGMKLFSVIEKKLGKQRIIAEDLGFSTDSVKRLLADTNFPGMKVLQFGFDSRDSNTSEYVPHLITEHSIAYTGTHDNDTVLGWFNSICKEDRQYVLDYLRIRDLSEISWDMIAAVMKSSAMISIVPAQDILGLGTEARMNIPSTLGNNWLWRAKPGSFDKALANKLAYMTELYSRGRT